MQFIAKYFGSTLKKVVNHVNVDHSIALKNKFWGTKLLKDKKMVNSFHNYGIDLLSDELINIAVSDDNCVEAYIHSSLKIFCHMWHPERERPFKNTDIDIIRTFFSNKKLT